MRCLVRKFQRKFEDLIDEGFEDLLQECLIHWLFTKDQYDAGEGVSMRTFLDKVVSNKLLDLVRQKYAKKRKGFYKHLSLEELPGQKEEKFLADKSSVNSLYNSELPEAVRKTLEKLSTRQRELCGLLGEEGLSVREASRHLNIPRATLQDEIKRIKEIFKKQGLQDYLA